MEIYLGTIVMFTYNFEVLGFAMCDGRLLQIQQYSALFSLIGTFFGGNGTTNFALPDLRGRVPIGLGAAAGRTAYTLGQSGGVETVTLAAANVPVPSHTHPVNASSATAGRGTSPNGNVLAVPANGVEIYNAAPTAGIIMNAGMIGPPAAGNPPTPVSVIQPYQAVSYQIAMEGIYPPRA